MAQVNIRVPDQELEILRNWAEADEGVSGLIRRLYRDALGLGSEQLAELLTETAEQDKLIAEQRTELAHQSEELAWLRRQLAARKRDNEKLQGRFGQREFQLTTS